MDFVSWFRGIPTLCLWLSSTTALLSIPFVFFGPLPRPPHAQHQSVSAGHLLAIPFDTPNQQINPPLIYRSSVVSSQNVLPSHYFFFFDSHSFDYRRHCTGMEITLHLPVGIEYYCRDSTALTNARKTSYGPLRTSKWCRPNRLQTRGPDLVLRLFLPSLRSFSLPVGVVEPGALSGRTLTTFKTQVSLRFGSVP